ncbi:glycosyltransferase family 4 protein [Providencia manganoxydans]|uniref:glycosyltransferase family 4 protein n=1 Tax=Providencia manganoxydans TaxID=2923283 RepID=UPI0034E5E6B6
MIIFDGIIEKIQSSGGITVLFKEIISRTNDYKYLSFQTNSNIAASYTLLKHRLLERYRDVKVPKEYIANNPIFHSTYYRLPEKRTIPIVTTVHDFTYERYVTGPSRQIHSWQKYRAIKNSDAIICVSHNTAKDLVELYDIDDSKISIIHNGVSDDYNVLENRQSESNNVIFIGARSGYKNFLNAVDAISLCPKLYLTIVGGSKLTKKELNYLNNKLPFRFKWVGYLDNNELNILYNQAYCLLYPSSYEGFGIPVIEAMKAGCPVIAINSSSIPEVSGSSAILLDSAKPNLIANALNELSNSDYRKKLIQSGLINSKRFSWELCFKETNMLYNSLL